jgi:hypothetical protein
VQGCSVSPARARTATPRYRARQRQPFDVGRGTFEVTRWPVRVYMGDAMPVPHTIKYERAASWVTFGVGNCGGGLVQ